MLTNHEQMMSIDTGSAECDGSRTRGAPHRPVGALPRESGPANLTRGGLRSIWSLVEIGDMTKIAKVELIPLVHRLAEGRSYGMARGLAAARHTSIVRLVTDEGV